MMLTYDDIWSTFLDNYKVNPRDVSQEDWQIYNDINNAVLMYNQKMRTQFECDDSAEMVVGASTYDERLLIAHYIRLVYLINEKTLYESLYQPISPDVGVRSNKSQMDSLTGSIRRQEDRIDQFIFNTREGLF